MDNITLRELKKYLKARTKDELVQDIADLFTRLDTVKDYYQLRLGTGPNEALLDRYKAAIQDEFFPARGYGDGRLSIARKPVTEYKKVSKSPEGLIDLMLFYVEMGVRFTNTYGDIDAPFYNSMESMYERAVELIAKHNLHNPFEARCRKIVEDTSGIGWGFHDMLTDIYGRHFRASKRGRPRR